MWSSLNKQSRDSDGAGSAKPDILPETKIATLTIAPLNLKPRPQNRGFFY
jgi:hypothetical protein